MDPRNQPTGHRVLCMALPRLSQRSTAHLPISHRSTDNNKKVQKDIAYSSLF